MIKWGFFCNCSQYLGYIRWSVLYSVSLSAFKSCNACTDILNYLHDVISTPVYSLGNQRRPGEYTSWYPCGLYGLDNVECYGCSRNYFGTLPKLVQRGVAQISHNLLTSSKIPPIPPRRLRLQDNVWQTVQSSVKC